MSLSHVQSIVSPIGKAYKLNTIGGTYSSLASPCYLHLSLQEECHQDGSEPACLYERTGCDGLTQYTKLLESCPHGSTRYRVIGFRNVYKHEECLDSMLPTLILSLPHRIVHPLPFLKPH